MKLTWIIPSVMITLVAMIISVLSMGGGHGTYQPTIFIFPFSMLIAVLAKEINLVAIVLAFIQYPGYACIYSHCRNAPARVSFITLCLIVHITVYLWTVQSKGDLF